ncbi:hypothetical protein NP493_288g03005 [Ridgeia piscesae]|uniref:PiggyBac transposable element-derived protein domain-containing protein n=1 Tax=Ridgeia piscesae TaxID=27915 RepID=A0AAD9NWZ8_RIDPI|nr:hypothetical protein NP493_288g03005 [Ridgeia piscesae]
MADDGAISDGSDIYDGDTEIGSNTGSSSTSLSSESDLEERHAVGEQWVRNLFAEDDSDDSVFAGFQAAWKERDFVDRLTMDFRGIGGASVLHPPEANPGMYFDQFWTGEMWQQLVDETNRYADQERRRNPPPPSAPIWMPVATDEMRAFVGLCFAMGILRLPSRNDYWRVSNWLLKTNFGTVMARDRFNLIWRYLHLANNDAPGAEGDKLIKIRWFVDFLNDQFQAVYVPYGKYTVDESMVKFKGRLEFRQYLPAKPTKWGVKVWVLAESDTGYLSKFQVYTGRAPGGQERGLTHRVVTDLVDHLYGQYTQVYFDNFYTSPDLLTYLHARQVYACGTVRANRKNLPTALLPKNVNLQRHEFKVAQKDELSFVVWQDTKPVCVLSNFHDPTAMGAVSRRVRLGGGAQHVAVPAVVADYQKYMKGVDLMDQMVGYYIIQHRSKKWWRRIFHYLMMASAYNAYVVARDTSPEMVATEWPNFQDFLEEIVLWLVGEVRSRRDPAANPRPAPGAGRHDIVKMYEKKRTCIECSMSAAAGERRGTTKHGCQQCQQPVHLECVSTHFHRLFNL